METKQESTTSGSRVVGIAALFAGLLLLALIVLPFFSGEMSNSAAALKAPTSASADGSPSASPDLAQCRVDAVLAYMKTQGFKDGDYVIGEENIDRDASELTETGSLAFGKDGANVVTRKQLTAVFKSTTSELRPVVNAQVAKFPSLGEDVVLNAENWEVVQMKVESHIAGNTGLSGTTVVSLGTRESAAGDGAWLFINPATCKVAVAEVQPATATAGDAPAVGLIRVGCINPGDNITPPPPPPAPPVTPPKPPKPPQEHVCPPDMPHGTWPVCKDDPSNDPGPQGNAPDGSGPNADPGPGEYIPPEEMEQPPSTPRVNPPPPAPEPPAPTQPTPDNPSPAPVPTPDPAPAPSPQPEAPTPTDPETGCDPSAPGGSDC